ncbi:MAG: glucose-6-phosphate isomerase [Pseudomonadota bacterium]
MSEVSAAFDALRHYRDETKDIPIADRFETDPDRFSRFSIDAEGILLDYSKTHLSDRAKRLLIALAKAADVEGQRDKMVSGKPINLTEGRAVLHTALRAPRNASLILDGRNIVKDVQRVLDRMNEFSRRVRSGALTGADGQAFTDVVNIGIGGSDLGPAMATAALAPFHDGPRVHFVSNVDGAHIHGTLKTLDPKTTLILIASKTFTTIETMTNAETARKWLEAGVGSAVDRHLAAISTALDKTEAFGIPEDRVFGFWDWVGGRYSVWSAIGLSLMIAIGPDRFRAFLDGAHAIDRHFCQEPPENNLPIMLGLIGVWHRNICDWPTRAVLPYDQRLNRLPAYLQQLDMESNGKSVRESGEALTEASGPVVWGEPGTNGQHAFYQLLHQGMSVIPAEFLVAAKGHETDLDHQHVLLLANCLAQSEALMRGKTTDAVRKEMIASGRAVEDAEALAPHRTFPGNRPSVTLLYPTLDPVMLGKIIALYEHRVFVEAAIWGINAFDQWGVELGKTLAKELAPHLNGANASVAPASSRGIIRAVRHRRELA